MSSGICLVVRAPSILTATEYTTTVARPPTDRAFRLARATRASLNLPDGDSPTAVAHALKGNRPVWAASEAFRTRRAMREAFPLKPLAPEVLMKPRGGTS